jgi:hypothetical protein
MYHRLIRRIGTWEHTQAWDESWLPRDEVVRPITCLLKADMPLFVADFIDQTSAIWDMKKSLGLFLTNGHRGDYFDPFEH